MRRLILTGLLMTAACVAFGFWAVHPYLAYNLPAVPDWMPPAEYAQLLREHYPGHLLNPAWFSYGNNWPLAETAARLGMVVAGLLLSLTVGGFARHEQNTPN